MLTLHARGLLFDLDGVFIDSSEAVERHWCMFAEEYGIDPQQLLTRVHGIPNTAIIARELADRPHEIPAALKFHVQIEESDAVNETPLPGAVAVRGSLPVDGWAVVTSCWRGLAELRAEAAGIPLPAALVTADQLERGKPYPDGYLRAAELLDLSASECVVFEDAPTGIAAGVAAGARVVALRTTAQPELLSGATVIVEDLSRVRIEHDGHQFAVHLDDESAEM